MKKIIEFLVLLALMTVLIYLGRPKLAAFYHNQGINYYNRGLYKEAITYFEKSLKIDDSAATAHYNLGNAYRENKMEDKAIEEYKRVIKIDPNNFAAYQTMSQIYSDRQMYQQALDLLGQAETVVSDNQGIKELIDNVSFAYMVDCLNKGVDLFLSGDKQKAYTLLNRAIKTKWDFAYAHYILGYFYYTDHNYDMAKNKIKEAIELNPRLWFADKLLGDIYFAQGNYEKAIERYKAVLAKNNNDVILRNDLGIALMKMERYDEAVVHLKKALRLEPDNLDIRYSLASVYRDKGMFNEAISMYKDLIRRQVDYPNIHNTLGDIYKLQEKDEQALTEYNKQIEYCHLRISTNPDDVVMLNNLAHAYNAIGEYNKAEKIIKNVIVLQPNYRQAYLTLAKIKEKGSDYKQRLAALSKAKSLSKQMSFIDRDISRLKKMLSSFTEIPISLDKIYLRNGRILKGVIKKETDEKIVLEVYLGNSKGKVTLYHKDIKHIVRRPRK